VTDHEPEEETRSLASHLAHELKNPVMAIQGLSSTAARLYDDMSDDERREFFRLITQESGRLVQVVDQAATALTIEAGELAYLIRPEPLGRLVGAAVKEASVGEHPIEIEMDEDEDGAADLIVACDALRTKWVLIAGIQNAASYSPARSLIRIRAGRGPDSGTALVEIEDEGPGLSADERERVFGRYVAQRAPGYEDVPGAGLSLYIARAHIEAQGGRIWLEPGKEVGTILEFTLPLEAMAS
jgi:K+-sensing histidine kinase KdpD